MAIDKNVVIKESQKYIAKGQFDKAIAEWKKLLSESPNDANIFNTIGDLCLKKDSKAEAVDAYKKAADILAADGFSSKAIALYKKVLNIDPKKMEAHLALADLNAEKGLTGNALESYKIVADHYTQNKQQNKALGIYQKMADLNPANISFRLKLADMYAKEGMKKESVAAYLAAADVHVSKGAYKDARQILEKALAVDPNSREVYHQAGIVYLKDGKFVEACKSLKPVYEADPSNKELTELYLEALTKAGRDAEAEELYKKVLSEEPGRLDLREKLFNLYISRKEHDKALNQAAIIAEQRLKSRAESADKGVKLLSGEGDAELDEAANAALERLKTLVDESPGFADARRTLGDFYAKVGRGGDAARELVEAAKILIRDGENDDAKATLARAIELAPDSAEARQLLKSLEPPPPEPEPAPPIPVEEPIIQAAAGASPAVIPQMAEDAAVTAAVSEVDVLVKYGLASKALEQLEGLAGTFPESALIRIKLRDLYGDQGALAKAAGHMLVLADIYTTQGQHDRVEPLLRQALEMDPQNREIQSRLGIEEPASPPSAAAEPVFETPPPAAPAVEDVPSLDVTDITSGLDLALPEQFGAGTQIQEQPVTPPLPQPAAGEIAFDEPFTIPEEQPQPATEEAPQAEEPPEYIPEQPPAVAGEPAAVDLNEIWAEAEFYFQQGLFDEAKKHYAKIIQHDPGDERAIRRLSEISREAEETHEFSKLADAVDGLEKSAGSPSAGEEMPASTSDEEAVRLLMQEIAQLKAEQTHDVPIAAPPREKAPERSPAAAVNSQAERLEEDFFDLGEELRDGGTALASTKPAESAGDDFFDLASELRDELSTVGVTPSVSASVEDQSLDDIFEEFKKGVEQQAVKEDVDTHYNLGVAYKEMGLLDDAIGEFILTPEHEPKFLQSRYMLGLCYMEKGEYQNAIAEIQSALSNSENANSDARELINLRYDLALAYQGAGDRNSALSEFQKVYEVDPGYRDAEGKIKELQQGDFISLEQLKDDIEKEISSKFLEEGERIEREEKIRKSEKVRN